jgi:hypothetical protein
VRFLKDAYHLYILILTKYVSKLNKSPSQSQ